MKSLGAPPQDRLAALPVRRHHIFSRGGSREKNRFVLGTPVA
jgi:hypothetical protein